MKELIEKIDTLLVSFKKDALAQAEHGNKSAGMRARKISSEFEKLMKEFRKKSLSAAKK